MKDDTGSNAVSTEQGSSASRMTAAGLLDVISRLPVCAGAPSDAVSAHAPVKMEAPDLLRLPKSECPATWIRLPCSRFPKSWDKIHLARNLFEHPMEGFLWERKFETFLLKEIGRKYWDGSADPFTSKWTYFCLCMWTT